MTFHKVDSVQIAPREVSAIANEKVTKVGRLMTINNDVVMSAINKYFSEIELDENARYLSWEHCYKAFQKTHSKPLLTDSDIDYLSLQLSFYLASWGMIRGSSFLLQKVYRVQTDIVRELYKPCYKKLWCISYTDLQKQENLETLLNLMKKMKAIYKIKRKNPKEVKTDISKILVTKVLLGTLGCVPAYDVYFKTGISKYKITSQSLSQASIKGLAEYYEDNEKDFEHVRRSISLTRQVEYPQMKILDMAFWQLGFDLSE